ncbi:MAG: ParD-like family protein [Desulfotignum sp.]|nr:ParD-like family protein [Desulfotignum sp.]MCF8089289.1 ParD-like family protein [Desulfotignum sp.]MCF8137556.1 ParD-like family protein [Desulfotignum sp.]
MATAVKISDELFKKAKTKSKVYKRSIAGQIEYWAKIGQLIEENPDLPLSFIQDILEGKEQIKAGQGTPYVFGEGE